MKIFKLVLVSIGFALFVFACSQNTANTNSTRITSNQNGTIVSYDTASPNTNSAQPVATPDEMAAIKKVYTEKCVLCHKENGEGGQVDIEGDKFNVPSFKDPKVAAFDDKKYTRVIEEGDDKMPGFKKQLKPEEIAGLIKYIRKDFQGK